MPNATPQINCNVETKLGPEYNWLFHKSANIRLATAILPIVQLMDVLLHDMKESEGRLKIVETSITASNADSSANRLRLKELLDDRRNILDKLRVCAESIANQTTDVVKDTTKATADLVTVLKGIEDSLHQTKGMLKDLIASPTTLASAGLTATRAHLSDVRNEASQLRERAVVETDLKVFAGTGLKAIKHFGWVFFGGLFAVLLAHHFDPQVFSHFMGPGADTPPNMFLWVLMMVFGVLSMIGSLNLLLQFWDHYDRCKSGPHPAELTADKDALAYARAIVAAAESAAKS